MPKKAYADPRQGDLFDLAARAKNMEIPPTPKKTSAEAINHRLKMALSAAIRSSPLNRAAIAGAVSELTGRPFTEAALNTLTAPSKTDHRLHADLIPAFCIVLGADLISELATLSGCKVVTAEDLHLVRLGWMVLVRQELDQEIHHSIANTPLIKGAAA